MKDCFHDARPDLQEDLVEVDAPGILNTRASRSMHKLQHLLSACSTIDALIGRLSIMWRMIVQRPDIFVYGILCQSLQDTPRDEGTRAHLAQGPAAASHLNSAADNDQLECNHD